MLGREVDAIPTYRENGSNIPLKQNAEYMAFTKHLFKVETRI